MACYAQAKVYAMAQVRREAQQRRRLRDVSFANVSRHCLEAKS
jgi:hypothetical protein